MYAVRFSSSLFACLNNIVQKYNAFFTLSILFIANVYLLWPGIMSPDGLMQYKEALSGVFTDHHPPIMAVLWRLFTAVYHGSGPIFFMHMVLLYSACAVFVCAFNNQNVRWFYVIYPLFPSISLYSSMIWKDVGFAFSYLLLSALIIYYVMRRERPSCVILPIMALVLFYGTAIKFQALFVAPVMVSGICYVMYNFQLTSQMLKSSIRSYGALYASIVFFNNFFVLPEHQSHSWKYVKIYDLAAISITTNQSLFPDYIKNYSLFSFEKVQEKFNYERVDDIVFFNDSPIPRATNKQERKQLLNAWWHAVKKYPLLYIKHRTKNWSRILWAKPFEKLDTTNYQDGVTQGFVAKLLQNKFCMFCIRMVRYGLSFSVVVLLMLCYIVLGFVKHKERLAGPLLIMNGSACILVLSLFPFSMASSLRYVYMAVCLVHASHPLVYKLLQKKEY